MYCVHSKRNNDDNKFSTTYLRKSHEFVDTGQRTWLLLVILERNICSGIFVNGNYYTHIARMTKF